MIFVGDDWSESDHEIWMMDETGTKLGRHRLAEGVEGMRKLHELLASRVPDPTEVVIGIETDRGLWVEALVAAGYQVHAPNPKAVARYRERHHVGGGKSDVSDAKVLADLVRTDRHNHRLLAGDTPEAEAIKALARTHQNLIWERKRHGNRLRSSLREYYPSALATFSDLSDRDALAVLRTAPTPRQGGRLSLTQIRAALKAGGRQRNLGPRASQIQKGLRVPQLEAPTPVAEALAAITLATVAIITELNHQIERLEELLAEHFEEHPDADIYLSMPGLGSVLGARVLGEFGDDPDRYADAQSRRNYAGTSPLTIASGKQRAVIARYVRNNRLIDAVSWWAFCSLLPSPGCQAFYRDRRARGDTHSQALRRLGNRMVGILDFCLRNRLLYAEHEAWKHRPLTAEDAAA